MKFCTYFNVYFLDVSFDDVNQTEKVRDKKELSFEMVKNYTKELSIEKQGIYH